MKKIILQIVVVLSFSLFVFGQEQKTDKWVRVQSDDGEFSIELPEKYAYFYDKTGFSTNLSSFPFQYAEMHLVSVYFDKTLLSFESYKTPPEALDEFVATDKFFAKSETKEFASSKLQKDGFQIKQLKYKTEKFTAVKQYFSSKTHIYILTTGVREGETEAMKHFLNSLIFKPNAKNEQLPDAIRFANLKQSEIETVTKIEPIVQDQNVTAKQINDPNVLPLAFVSRPAMSRGFTGLRSENKSIQMRVTFSSEGIITKIGIIKGLSSGLLRQALFWAIRIKFLPEERYGKPTSVEWTVQYSLGDF